MCIFEVLGYSFAIWTHYLNSKVVTLERWVQNKRVVSNEKQKIVTKVEENFLFLFNSDKGGSLKRVQVELLFGIHPLQRATDYLYDRLGILRVYVSKSRSNKFEP